MFKNNKVDLKGMACYLWAFCEPALHSSGLSAGHLSGCVKCDFVRMDTDVIAAKLADFDL